MILNYQHYILHLVIFQTNIQIRFYENEKEKVLLIIEKISPPYLHGQFYHNDDYFQQTFENYGHKGYGHILHDALISNRTNLLFINNIYSTDDINDKLIHPNLVMSNCALKFWNKRLLNNNALFDNPKNRYMLIW